MTGPQHQAEQVVSEARMRKLVESGQAVPLLPGFFPAPVRYAGTWWYCPLDALDRHYIPSTAEQARQYERLAQRHRAGRPGGDT
jgi:hypothetical protein